MKKEINSTEVARLAGVSRSTVSRVINGYRNVPQETHDKVMKVIDQYRYVPNHSAQVLKGKPTRTLGLFWVARGRIAEDFLAEYIIVSIIENAAAMGYHILTCVVPDLRDKDHVRTVRELFQQRRIDGGIFIGLNSEEPFIEELAQEGFVLGLFDARPRPDLASGCVVVNFESETASQAVEHLYRHGHRNIGLINGDLLRHSGMQKYDGFLEGLHRCGLQVNPQWVEYNNFSQASGREAMQAILGRCDALPTAFCCANDAIAFGVVEALEAAGYRVPQEVSVIGIDDHMRSATFHPPLTTFRIDFDAMLATLTRKVIEVSRGESEGETIAFSGTLVERRSVRDV
jgi:LacI family transcriptional regulator